MRESSRYICSTMPWHREYPLPPALNELIDSIGSRGEGTHILIGPMFALWVRENMGGIAQLLRVALDYLRKRSLSRSYTFTSKLYLLPLTTKEDGTPLGVPLIIW